MEVKNIRDIFYVEETSNEIDMICEVESGACSHLGAKPESKMQNIENRNDIDGGGRSFVYSTQSSMVDVEQDSSAARLTGSISQNMLSDQIKNFDNIRIGLEAAAAAAAAAATGGVVGFTPESALAAANYANKLANLQILTSISSFMAVENK